MLLPKIAHSLNVARSGLYFIEALPFALVSRWLANPDLPPPTPEQVAILWRHILRLHQTDAQNLADGVYPLKALDIENPLHHVRSYLEVLGDGFKVALRMRQRKSRVFSKAADGLRDELPDYYVRNFHFQTDGYLSEASARRYDHQVEILFSGTAGAMRRSILPVLKSTGAAGGRWLELGCGSGSATKPVLETFPQARITALDLSGPYLKVAQDHLRTQRKVDFLQGDATNLEFKTGTFDVVYSVFVLHELPKAERSALIREAFRVLKPGGILLLADSLQMDDEPELNWALQRFPRAYHEPFFKDYVESDLKLTLKKITACDAKVERGFLTKVVSVQKPSASTLS